MIEYVGHGLLSGLPISITGRMGVKLILSKVQIKLLQIMLRCILRMVALFPKVCKPESLTQPTVLLTRIIILDVEDIIHLHSVMVMDLMKWVVEYTRWIGVLTEFECGLFPENISLMISLPENQPPMDGVWFVLCQLDILTSLA
jgi:hypothetical protein